MNRVLIILLFALQDGSCTPAVRVLFDGKNTRDDFSPVLTRQDLWELYKDHFSATPPRISQYDAYVSPASEVSYMRNFRLSNNKNNDKSFHTWLSECDNADETKKSGYLLTMGEKSDGTRCRRTSNGWTIEEPLIVDEPSWILIGDDVNSDFQQRNIKNNVDPFYITRGKRSLFNNNNNNNEKNKNITKSVNSTRTKREALMIDTKDNFEMNVGGNERKNGYVSPRDKHGDILDILQDEPFFISRGKKTTSGKNIKDNRYRNRRGEVENLLKDQDPFYVARGRRTSSSRFWIPMLLASSQQ